MKSSSWPVVTSRPYPLRRCQIARENRVHPSPRWQQTAPARLTKIRIPLHRMNDHESTKGNLDMSRVDTLGTRELSSASNPKDPSGSPSVIPMGKGSISESTLPGMDCDELRSVIKTSSERR